jgi:hypothetical protein
MHALLQRPGTGLWVLGLILVLIELCGAQSAATDLDITEVGENVIEHMPTLLAVLTAAAFFFGFVLFVSGLSKSNTLSNQRAAHVLGGQQTSFMGPGMSLLVGVALMFSAALVLIEKNSFFGEEVKSVTIKGIKQLPE